MTSARLRSVARRDTPTTASGHMPWTRPVSSRDPMRVSNIEDRVGRFQEWSGIEGTEQQVQHEAVEGQTWRDDDDPPPLDRLIRPTTTRQDRPLGAGTAETAPRVSARWLARWGSAISAG